MAEILNTKQAAAHLKVSEKTVCRLFSERQINAIRVGPTGNGPWRVLDHQLDDFVRNGSFIARFPSGRLPGNRPLK